MCLANQINQVNAHSHVKLSVSFINLCIFNLKNALKSAKFPLKHLV